MENNQSLYSIASKERPNSRTGTGTCNNCLRINKYNKVSTDLIISRHYITNENNDIKDAEDDNQDEDNKIKIDFCKIPALIALIMK